jgi:membrane fusion protein (multidrug efflux system)
MMGDVIDPPADSPRVLRPDGPGRLISQEDPVGWSDAPGMPAMGGRPDPAPDAAPPPGQLASTNLARRHPLGTSAGALLLAATVAGGVLYWDHARHFESTDDAFVAARNFVIAPKVPGYLSAVPVTDNQHLAAGDVIARIDDRDFRTALAQAEAQVSAARAAIQGIDAQIAVQQAQVTEAEAQLDQARATLTFAQQQAARFADLAKRGYGPVETAQQTASQLRQQEAQLRTSEATLDATRRQLATLQAQRANAEANLAQAAAQRDQAALNLSYATITAAQPGRVVALSAAVGAYAAAGTSLSMFVPDALWVAANFKETQLDAMRPGQPVSMRIDAYPERPLRGHVDSVQPGSGTAFSLLPAENATGNFVKITQRVPVKLVLDQVPEDVALGPGMSVVPTVRVDPAPSLYERLRSWL